MANNIFYFFPCVELHQLPLLLISAHMKFNKSYTLAEIAAIIDCRFVGSAEHPVTGINEIHMVETGDLVFVDHPKYYQKALDSAATTILIDQETDCPSGKGLIISATPFDDFNKLTRHFKPFKAPTAIQGHGVEVDPSSAVHPGVYLGNQVKIGKRCVIYPGVVLGDGTVIGDDVIIGPNTVIGHSAFYYKKKATGYDRMYSCGSVTIEDRVEIGANCTIDSGVTGITRIGEGSKLDNLIQIGHDTVIGKNCLIASQVGVAGCVSIGDQVTLWGQVGSTSGITIGEGAVVLAQSGISKSLAGGVTYFGSPCGEVREKFREMAALRKLPEIIENL